MDEMMRQQMSALAVLMEKGMATKGFKLTKDAYILSPSGSRDILWGDLFGAAMVGKYGIAYTRQQWIDRIGVSYLGFFARELDMPILLLAAIDTIQIDQVERLGPKDGSRNILAFLKGSMPTFEAQFLQAIASESRALSSYE